MNLIQRVPLGTPLHDVLVSLPQNHVTLTISLSLVTGAIVITFKHLKQVLDKSPYSTFPLGEVRSRAANNCRFLPVIFAFSPINFFFYWSMNICLIILSNVLFCMEIKAMYYYSTKAVVWWCSVKKGSS